MNHPIKPLTRAEQEALDRTPSNVGDLAGHIRIQFQCGPIGEHGVNGTTIEEVTRLLITRLEGFQCGPFRCDENRHALWHLRGAIKCLEARTLRREIAGLEGTNEGL